MPTRVESWYENPLQLENNYRESVDAAQADIDEGKAAESLYHSRPDWGDSTAVINKAEYSGYRKYGFNLVVETCNAVRSEVCKPVQTKLVPVGGNFDASQAADTFNALIDWKLEEQNFTELHGRVFTDSELCGRGYGLWDFDPLTADLVGSRLSPFRTFYNTDFTEVRFVRLMPRRTALARYGAKSPGAAEDAAAKIANCDSATPDFINRVSSESRQYANEDLVEVYEAYAEKLGNLPGRHLVRINKTTVLDEPWDAKVPVWCIDFDAGFEEGEAKSLARQVMPYAVWQNWLAKSYHEQLGGSRTIVTKRPEVKIEVTNENWQYWDVPEGVEEPKITTLASVSADGKEALDRIHDSCFTEIGVNQAQAAGEPPPAYKSGLAIQEWKKSLLSRLSTIQRAAESGWLWSLRILAELFPKYYAGKPARFLAPNTGMLEEIDFDSLKVKEHAANWTFQLVSGLSLTDSGKLEVMGQFQESMPDVITAEVVLAQLSAPDLRAVKEQALGHYNLIEKQICEARDHARLLPPVDGQDYQKAAGRASNAYAAAIVRGIYPRKNLEVLRCLYHLFLARVNAPPEIMPNPAAEAVPAPVAAEPAPVSIPTTELPGDAAVAA
jgi:hypothetical protein